MKYVRLYGFNHKRTEGQFEITWKELQQGLPAGHDGNFLLGVSENRLLLDGVALETGQAERSFAQFLNTAGLASIQFSNQVTLDDFAKLIRAFAVGGSKAQDVVKEIKGPPAEFPNVKLSVAAKGGDKFQVGYASGPIKPGKSVTITLVKGGLYLIGCAFHYHQGMHDVISIGKEARPGPQATPPTPSPTNHPTSRSSYNPG